MISEKNQTTNSYVPTQIERVIAAMQYWLFGGLVFQIIFLRSYKHTKNNSIIFIKKHVKRSLKLGIFTFINTFLLVFFTQMAESSLRIIKKDGLNMTGQATFRAIAATCSILLLPIFIIGIVIFCKMVSGTKKALRGE